MKKRVARMKDKNLAKWEIWGAVYIIVLGTLLHFAFAWSGKNLFVAPFAAVNESVWEHLKLVFWPALLFALVEFNFLRKKLALKEKENFWIAKSLAIPMAMIFIIGSFYLYTAFIPDNLFMDILIFILAVVLGQIVSYNLIVKPEWKNPNAKFLNALALRALAMIALCFVLFSFNPPRIFLFQDVSGIFGILNV